MNYNQQSTWNYLYLTRSQNSTVRPRLCILTLLLSNTWFLTIVFVILYMLLQNVGQYTSFTVVAFRHLDAIMFNCWLQNCVTWLRGSWQWQMIQKVPQLHLQGQQQEQGVLLLLLLDVKEELLMTTVNRRLHRFSILLAEIVPHYHKGEIGNAMHVKIPVQWKCVVMMAFAKHSRTGLFFWEGITLIQITSDWLQFTG